MTGKRKLSHREKKISIAASALVTCLLLWAMLCGMHVTDFDRAGDKNTDLVSRFDLFMANRCSDALDGIVSVEKVYMLRDEDLVAPAPNPEHYTETMDPASLGGLLEQAKDLLAGEDLLFSTGTQIKPGSKVICYLDETILAVTWKEIVGECVFTFSEVKIAHPSQFRRFMAGGTYGSGVLYTTTDMAASVKAVTASNGDYYSYRKYGVVVNNGKLYRNGDGGLDTCFVDEKGDLRFIERRTMSEDELARYVEEENIRFSLAFGPTMIRDGEVCVPYNYITGEIQETYSRAALCQLGNLHYMVVTTNKEPFYVHNPTVKGFAYALQEMGVENAYGLDGGQTATIVTRNELINDVDYGSQREISDIIYFATAVPEEN